MGQPRDVDSAADQHHRQPSAEGHWARLQPRPGKRIGVAIDLPEDAIAVCSFGDASANHATALAAINTARYAVRMGLPMPLLLVCEDNDTGISVATPEGWIGATFGNQPHLRYVLAEGDIDQVWESS